jgi:hypothetical protein
MPFDVLLDVFVLYRLSGQRFPGSLNQYLRLDKALVSW